MGCAAGSGENTLSSTLSPKTVSLNTFLAGVWGSLAGVRQSSPCGVRADELGRFGRVGRAGGDARGRGGTQSVSAALPLGVSGMAKMRSAQVRAPLRWQLVGASGVTSKGELNVSARRRKDKTCF